MNINNLIQELKRRNVFRVATAYAIAGWLIIQIVTVIEQPLALPDWFDTMIIILVSIGFPLALIFAWAFELTPEGIKKSEEVDITESVTKATGKKINGIIISALSLLVVFLLVERFFFAPVVRDIEVTEVSTVSSQSVAVLPFADLSENGDQEWFSDGLTEEILNSLAQLSELKVTSRTSSFQFKNKDIDISLIADTLGVANVVEGSVRRIGEQLRITAQLIRAEDGFHLWSETYDSSTEDLFDVQTSIAEEIANTLDVYLDEAKRERLFTSGTRNIEAYEEYLRGRQIYGAVHNTLRYDGLFEANEHFEKAIELDPQFGEPALYHMDLYAHILVEGAPLDSVIPLEVAHQELMDDLNFGSRNVENPILKITSEMDAVFFSDSWYKLPLLVQDVKNQMEAEGLSRFPPGTIWNNEILTISGEDELRGKDNYQTVQDNPLSIVSWNYYTLNVYSQKGLEAYRETIQEARENVGNNSLLDFIENYVIALENEVEILRVQYPDGFVMNEGYPATFKVFGSLIASVLGDEDYANELLEQYSSAREFDDANMVITLYQMGRVEQAKALVRKLDSQPAGPANLVMDIALFGNLLYFELEDAPNTAARLQEAGIDVSEFKKIPWLE